MSTNVNIWSSVEAVFPNGQVVRIGDLSTAVPRTIQATDDEHFSARAIVADNYTAVTMWTAGDSGVSNFDVGIILSDQAVLAEFRSTAGTPDYAAIGIAANVPFIFSSDDFVAITSAIVSTTVQTSTTLLDRIVVQRNVANGQGDADVTLMLFT